MVKIGPHAISSRNLCTASNNIGPSISELPDEAILLESVKVLERALVARGLIHDPAATAVTPLWFLAETERNVYLWRRGCSIEDHDNFEFWVDLPSLVKKHGARLESFDPANPFHNPLWGAEAALSLDPKAARDYLAEITERFKVIVRHAHALSCATSRVRAELGAGAFARERVVLPQGRCD